MSQQPRIGIALPPNNGVGTGNLRTAQRWLRFFHEFGYDARILGLETPWDGEILIALNAVKSANIIARYRRDQPTGKLVVVVTGTDLNHTESAEWKNSLAAADRLIALQPLALKVFSKEEQAKATIIYQSQKAPTQLPKRHSNEGFQVCVVGHLRSEKDPLLTAMASRVLEDESQIQILQAGAILEQQYTQEVTLERQMNQRYQWLGELSKQESLNLIAESDLMVLSSLSEGGPAVIGEAISVNTPILSTRIDGVVGLLGEDYPGYFEPGDVLALAQLLKRAEKEPAFYQELQEAGAALKKKFDPAQEKESWQSLLNSLMD